MERRLWSQVVAVASGLPANVVAVRAIRQCQPLRFRALSCGFAGAPRGVFFQDIGITSLKT
jgi:hypothetical protein